MYMYKIQIGNTERYEGDTFYNPYLLMQHEGNFTQDQLQSLVNKARDEMDNKLLCCIVPYLEKYGFKEILTALFNEGL